MMLWVWENHLKALTDVFHGPSPDVSDRLLNKVKKNGDKIVVSHLEKNGRVSNQ